MDPVIPKIEILNDSDQEYQETNPIYVETSPDQNDKFQVTAEEQEVLTREGKNLLTSAIMCRIRMTHQWFRMGINRKEFEKSKKKDKEQDICSRISKEKTRLCQ